jgi:hypothetical protein
VGTNYVHEIGVFDGIRVLEFVPRDARYEAKARIRARQRVMLQNSFYRAGARCSGLLTGLWLTRETNIE